MEDILPPQILPSQNAVPDGARIVDAYPATAREFFFVTHPSYREKTPEGDAACEAFLASDKVREAWIYYPWRNTVLHIVGEEAYYALRTARNREVITTPEQARYRSLVMGVAGLSVGSGILEAVAMSGGPRQIKIADFDVIEASNLNRLRATALDLGSAKSAAAARRIWEIDPYAELEVWTEGVSSSSLPDFIGGKNPLQVFIDEMDAIDLKLQARLIAREHRIPVLMATDVGDGAVIDIERFDEDPKREIFHGLLEGVDPKNISQMTKREWVRLATRIVGPEYLNDRMRQSLLGIGKTIGGVPQLGTTASIAGAAMAFVLRRIANNEPMPSGRYEVGLESVFVPGYNDPERVAERKVQNEQFKKSFGT